MRFRSIWLKSDHLCRNLASLATVAKPANQIPTKPVRPKSRRIVPNSGQFSWNLVIFVGIGHFCQNPAILDFSETGRNLASKAGSGQFLQNPAILGQILVSFAWISSPVVFCHRWFVRKSQTLENIFREIIFSKKRLHWKYFTTKQTEHKSSNVLTISARALGDCLFSLTMCWRFRFARLLML